MKKYFCILFLLFGCSFITIPLSKMIITDRGKNIDIPPTTTKTNSPTTQFSSTPMPSVTNTPTLIQKWTSTPSEKKTSAAGFVSYGDLHIHTVCSDGEGTYEQMITQALRARLSFMAITDHRMDSSICQANLKKCQAETRLLCIPGMEISGRVHLLAIGITKSINADLPLNKQVKEIHHQGGLAIGAHPYSPKWMYNKNDFESGLDAIECPWEIAESPAPNNIPCVYNSDSHDIYVANMLKCVGTIKTLTELKQSLADRKCTRWDLAIP